MIGTPNQNVLAFMNAALECSVYVAPTDPGLTWPELLEIGKRADFQEGELGDALPRLGSQHLPNGRLGPSAVLSTTWQFFNPREEPDYRVPIAFDFVHSEFNKLARSLGSAKARAERSSLVERAVAQGLKAHDVEVALTILLITEHLIIKDQMLMRRSGGTYEPLPSEQIRSAQGQLFPRPMRAKAYPIVKDVVERRVDGRPTFAEPLDAFTDALDDLGYKPFRMWWTQAVGEMRRADASSFPTSIAVLSAALVEGALTFVVRHARSLTTVGPMGSTKFDGDPRTWRIDDLVKSAAAGGDAAILTADVRQRAERVIAIRQRVHAGRMLSEFPGGAPDLRPEEARESRETAEMVVRAVLDWLHRYPLV